MSLIIPKNTVTDKASILRCLLISILLLGNPVFAAWVKLDPPPSRAAWSSIATSADGTRMGAVVDGGYIWISTDAGDTWNAREMAGNRNWKSIAISDDGLRMVATETTTTESNFFGDIITTYSSEIWISNDGGVTWALSVKRASGYFREIVITPDGRKIAAVGYGGVWISVDGGVSWTPRSVMPAQTSSVSNSLVPSVTLTKPDMTPIWNSAAFSNDGGRLWMVGYPHGFAGADQMSVSDDDGASWSDVPGLSLFSGKITVSPDGQKVVIASTGYNVSTIWVSMDAGSTWTQQKVAGRHAWVSVAISSDGMTIAAASANGGLWLTRDGGSSWQQAFAAGSRFWCDIACSSDGTQLAAVANNGSIWTSADAGATWGRDEDAGGNFSYSWKSLAMSDDGTRITVAEGNGGLWSLNPIGPEWKELQGTAPQLWQGLASSGDGTQLSAVGLNNPFSSGHIWGSSDSGLNWSPRTGLVQTSWTRSLAMSGDASVLMSGVGLNEIWSSPDQGITWSPQLEAKLGVIESMTVSTDGSLVAVVASGLLWTSEDQGKRWVYRSGLPSHRGSRSIACSSDGSRLVIADNLYQQIGSIWTSQDRGITWTERTSAGVRQWSAAASSSDGMKLAAAVNGGSLWTSTDAGATWTECAGTSNQTWQSITSSQDGQRLVAATYASGIWRSDDGGSTWGLCPGTQGKSWSSLAASGTGTQLAVLGPNGSVWTSLNQGSTWVERQATQNGKWLSLAFSLDGAQLIAASMEQGVWRSVDGGASWLRPNDLRAQYWTCITSSKDGQRQAAASQTSYGLEGCIYTTRNGGVSWTAQAAASKRDWVSITSSSDGSMLYAADNSWNEQKKSALGSLWASRDGGITWKERTAAGKRNWSSLSCTADGRRLVAAVQYGPILTSEDYGATWTLRGGPGSRNWTSAAWSGDGSRIAAAARQGGLWTSSDGGKTWQEGAGTQFQNWSCIQLSADGHRLAATESAGGLWINDLKIQVSNGSTLSAPVASSIGSTQYQWFKDGVVIRGATSATFNPASGLLYTGSYTVRLTTTTGSKVIYTETSSPMLLEHVDASMLIYKLTATGTTYTGKIKSNSAVTGYLILDRGRQRGGLIWRQTFGKQSTHSLELLENLHTRYTTSIPQGQMVISDLSDGLKDNADASALWLNGSITVITLRKTVPNLVGLQVLAPATLSGHSNLALNEGSTDPTTWQIETTAVKASLDTLETMATATYGRQDTVEAIMQRISQTLTLAGSILRASD